MTHFAGFAAPNDSGSPGSPLAALLQATGHGATFQATTGGAVVVAGGRGGEPVTVAACPDSGEITVRRGDTRTAGCAVTLSADPHALPRFEADPFGQHSLFTVRLHDGTLCFASDPRLLVTLTDKSLNAAALKGYLCFSHVPQPLTLWDGIDAVPTPTVDWTTPGNGFSDATGANELRTLLRAAVERRLTTGEIGVYLSGGLDSSLIAALLVEAGVRPKLFTLDFGPPHDAEVPLARAVAHHLRLPIAVVPARPRHIRGAVTATARALPQPFGDSVTVPLYLLGAHARDHVSEVWNGEGGDQLFGGWANKPMIAALTHGGDTSAAAELREYAQIYHRFWGMTDRLLTPALREASASFDPADSIRFAFDRAAHPTLLHRLRAANLRLKGAQNIAPRMTALAECHGLTVRAPFFDRDLARTSFALAPETLLSGACEKYRLKQVAEKYLPAEIVWRQKRGMGVPSTDWCLRPGLLGWDIRSRLSSRRLRTQGWFESAPLRQLLRGEDPTAEGSFRRRRIGEKLWLLYLLQVWGETQEVNQR